MPDQHPIDLGTEIRGLPPAAVLRLAGGLLDAATKQRVPERRALIRTAYLLVERVAMELGATLVVADAHAGSRSEPTLRVS